MLAQTSQVDVAQQIM
jgi:hypothetical protein